MAQVTLTTETFKQPGQPTIYHLSDQVNNGVHKSQLKIYHKFIKRL